MSEVEPFVIHPPEWIGQVDVSSDILLIGDLHVDSVGSGYPQANVYVERTSGLPRLREGVLSVVDGFPISRIIIEIIGDYTAQLALDAENAQAELYPGGPKEYWRSKGWSEEELEDFDEEENDPPPRCNWR